MYILAGNSPQLEQLEPHWCTLLTLVFPEFRFIEENFDTQYI